MATIASKIQWTTAAFAVAAAATLVPVAFADPTDPDAGDTAGAAVGSAAGQAPSRSSRKDRDRPESNLGTPQTGGSESTGSGSSGSGSASEPASGNSQGRASTGVTVPNANANATPPLAVGDEFTIIEVPLVADPDLQAATFGWMQNLNIDACVLGLSQKITGQQSVIGPYGTSSLSYSSSGCG